MPDSTLSSLSAIRYKVRRLTRSPSTAQLTNAQIDEQINNFVLYDFPEFTVDTPLKFYLAPNIDRYYDNPYTATSPLYGFKNTYLSVKEPFYVGGTRIAFTQSQDQFYGLYPKNTCEVSLGTGDGVTTNFTGTLSNHPFLPTSINISTINTNGDSIKVKDVPAADIYTVYDRSTGVLRNADSATNRGTINYLTGVYDITFGSTPANGEDIVFQAETYTTGKPTCVLYLNNVLTFRPVPDKSYNVEMIGFKRPSEMLAAGVTPDISQWWQYIAYGAAKKIFEDRMDVESVNIIYPEFMRQRSLVLQRLVVQQSSGRTATIYSGTIDNNLTA